MILQCGNLINSSHTHPIQNVIISKSGWTKISIMHNDTVIATCDNNPESGSIKIIINKKDMIRGKKIVNKTVIHNNSEYKFELTSGHGIILKCNDDELMSSEYLFFVDLYIDGVDDKTFSHRFENNFIVDH